MDDHREASANVVSGRAMGAAAIAEAMTAIRPMAHPFRVTFVLAPAVGFGFLIAIDYDAGWARLLDDIIPAYLELVKP